MTARTDDLLIGVDLGTSVVKAALYTPDGAARATTARATTLRQPAPGVAEQDPDEFVAAALAVIREVVAASGCASGAVAAIGFAGQMGGLLGIDKEWQAITPWYVSTLDTRYVPYVARMEAQAGPAMLALGGAVPIAGPRMLWWQQEHPALDARIAKVLSLANFVAGRLAGLTAEEAFVDPSYLTWFGLSDTANRIWSPELVEQVGLDATKLPRIVPAATRIGSLTPEAAAACGLRAGVALVAGAGDQVAGFLGAGLVDAGQVIDVAGTFPVLATPLDRFLPGARGATFQALAGPLDSAPWYAMMYIGGGGLTHRWFVENFGGGSAEGTASYAALDAQAAAVAPGAEGLIFLPHLGGRASPVDPDQRGAWLGITWTHGPAHFYRAVLEANAYPGPALISVYTTCQPEHGVGDHEAAQRARAAVDSRAFPLMIYDPRKGDTFRERLDLKGNPTVSEDWYVNPKTKEAFTFVDFARGEGRFAKHFDATGNPSPMLLSAEAERLANWRLLQDLAGVREAGKK
ncbi:MAG: xylulose kinase [Caldilinea sp.]|nr:xylulose kinase [Caldilinea sp.]